MESDPITVQCLTLIANDETYNVQKCSSCNSDNCSCNDKDMTLFPSKKLRPVNSFKVQEFPPVSSDVSKRPELKPMDVISNL